MSYADVLFHNNYLLMDIFSYMYLINIHKYTYGAGNIQNRGIEYYGDGDKIWGIVKGKTKIGWAEIGTIKEYQIFLETESTLQKIARAKSLNGYTHNVKCFSDLEYKERVSAIKNIGTKYCVSKFSSLGANPYFETTEKVTLYDPF